MPQQKTITTYSYDELSPNVKLMLVNQYAEGLSDHWHDPCLEDIEEEAADMGIEDFDLRYTGFWSQGDGLSFTGTLNEDLVVKILTEAVGKDFAEVYGRKIEVTVHRNTTMYVHHNSVECDFYYSDDDLEVSREDYERITEYFNDWKNNLCHQWYRRLEEYYDEVTSADHVAEAYSHLDFLEDGRIL